MPVLSRSVSLATTAARLLFVHRFVIRGALAACALILGCAVPRAAAATAEVLETRRIWDRGGHNAFTDLLRWHGRWWCTFRESDAHVGGDGIIRVITSTDGATWESAAAIAERDIDLRDPKLSVMPDDRLLLTCGGSVYLGGKVLRGRQPRVCFSQDGRTWTAPQRVLAEGDWLWRVTWHDGIAYGTSYRSADAKTGRPDTLSLFRSRDALAWELVTPVNVSGRPNETTLRFRRNGDMIALVRREAGNTLGFVGSAPPPYTQWTWRESNYRFGGPDFLQLPDGRWIVGTRDYSRPKQSGGPGAVMILAELHDDGKLARLVTLPSGGDTSYPGLVWHDGVLWVSYYSSHEGKTAIYLAKVKLAP